ncbi:DUF2812 domain-containing protein [Sporosarcina sp. CAU 1771]
MIKKWRPFWSYDVEKTEKWLSLNAAEGKKLVGVNPNSRMFVFEEAEREKVDYQVVYDRTHAGLPRALGESGWVKSITEGNWKFIKNGEESIQSFPSREGILRRNRLHSNIVTVVAFFSGMQSILLVLLLLVLIFSGEPIEGEGQLLWVLGLPILQSLVVVFLAVYTSIKLRRFENKFFETSIDEQTTKGETFVKWKFGWMYAPDLIENWLSDMAAKGNHLVRVGKPGTRFIFEKGAPKHVSYLYDYQLKTSPDYYDIHKSAGWQLKFTTQFSFTKYSIWQKDYEVGEKKPEFTYDALEKKAQVRRVVISSMTLTLYLLAVLAINLWLNFVNYQQSVINQVFVVLLIITLLIPIHLVTRVVLYARRMLHV